MQYMLLIYADPAEYAKMSEAENQANMEAYFAYNAETIQQGVHIAGEGLYPTTAAKTLRVRDGKALTVDGPFAETHEQLGGFYLLNCKDMDEALAWAAKIPDSKIGSIEVRPVMSYEQPASE
jgi:hypothetical protein